MVTRRTVLAYAPALLPATAAAQPPRWRLATGYRADSFHGRNLARLAGEWKAAGGMPLDLHANNTLVRLAEIPQAVRDGRAEIGEAIMTGMAAQWPLLGADAVPFLVGGYTEAATLWWHQRPLVQEALAAAGLVPLLAVPWPPQGLYTQRPIQRLADLSGLRMRTYNRTTERLAQLVGARPVDVPMVQVSAALADGRIDCMITSAVTGVENAVWGRLTHFYDINAWIPKNLTFTRTAALAELSAEQRQSLVRLAAEAEARGWAMSREAAAAATAELRRRGLAVLAPSNWLLAEFQRLAERFSLEWVREVGPLANRLLVPYYTRQ